MAARNKDRGYISSDQYKEEQDLDEDEQLLLELEKDDDEMMDRMREKRIQDLKKQFALSRARAEKLYGDYKTITIEKELMLLTTTTKKMIIHFAHKDFKKCKTMDVHLEKLAPKHHKTRFVKVDVENVPFLVARMEIKILPCIVMFIDGVGVDRLLGFEGVGGGENGDKDFPTWMLEKRLVQSGVIEGEKPQKIADIFKFKDNSESD